MPPLGYAKSRERLRVIPTARMKAEREHRVPLSDAAIASLRKQETIKSNDFVFAGRDGCVDKRTLGNVLKRLGRTDLTLHG